MKIVSSYVTKEYSKIFVLSLLVFIILFIVINFFEKMDMLLRFQASLADIIEYFLLKIPAIAIQVIPFTALLTTLIVIGIMKNRNEILVLRCSGSNVMSLVLPVAILGILLSAFEFYLNENLVPLANRRAKSVERIKIKKENPLQALENNEIWFRHERSFYRIELFLPDRSSAFGITILTFDENFRLIRRVDAKEAIWINRKWIAKNIITWIFFQDKSTYNHENELPVNIPYTPDDLKNEEIKPDEMNFAQLRRYINKMKEYGYSMPSYKTDLYFKLTFPLGVFIVSLLGVPISLRRFKKQGMATNMLIALTLAFLYWLLSAISRIAGASESLPPLLSSWVPNIIFLAAGIYLLWNAEW